MSTAASAESDALPGERLLSVPEAARLVGISPTTLRRWIREGRVQAYRTGRTRLWLRREDVERLRERTGERELSARERLRRSMQTKAPRRMTPEQQERGRRAVERSRRLHEKQLEEQGGEPFPESWEDLHEIREERSRQLS